MDTEVKHKDCGIRVALSDSGVDLRKQLWESFVPCASLFHSGMELRGGCVDLLLQAIRLSSQVCKLFVKIVEGVFRHPLTNPPNHSAPIMVQPSAASLNSFTDQETPAVSQPQISCALAVLDANAFDSKTMSALKVDFAHLRIEDLDRQLESANNQLRTATKELHIAQDEVQAWRTAFPHFLAQLDTAVKQRDMYRQQLQRQNQRKEPDMAVTELAFTDEAPTNRAQSSSDVHPPPHEMTVPTAAGRHKRRRT
ncbi:hypothetical protein HDV00_008643 [Rhizophlyctis rosea]|nr:hypothetical protein HDV00_008643 [Rhizophlyctis rosea]